MEIKVTKLPQAGMILDYDETRIICDPLLFPTSTSIMSVAPGFTLNLQSFRNFPLTAILISHHHGDHFDLKSLNIFNRLIPVYYPKGASFIASLLKSIGFKQILPMTPGESVQIGKLELIPFSSQVPFPEVGFAIRADNLSVWNLIDTSPFPEELIHLRENWGRPNLMFAYYQCINERGAMTGHIGGQFPINEYQRHLDKVRYAKPICVSPSSADLYNSQETWLNSSIYPVSQKRFIEDITTADPEIQGELIRAGMSVVITAEGVRHSCPHWPELEISSSHDEISWRPELAGRPITDHRPLKESIDIFKNEMAEFMRKTFMKLLPSITNLPLIQKFLRDKVSWKLRLVFPDTSEQVWSFVFEGEVDTWLREFSGEADLETICGAGDLLDYSEGKLELYAFTAGGYSRHINRYYRMKGWRAENGMNLDEAPFIPSLVLGRLAHFCWIERTISEISPRN